ncbi:hypothetical protein ACFWBI_03560 [Streptomyces sp. NPDC059982]|uniref:hypothetical protein n=1 Tax=unclassified Streptomyces TaxID=2593676 RepID=UPI003679CB8E
MPDPTAPDAPAPDPADPGSAAPGPAVPAPPPARAAEAGRKGWAAVGAVSLGIFCLITSELLPVGLLTSVGDALGVSEGTAGLDRRHVLCVLIALMAAANFAAAPRPSRWCWPPGCSSASASAGSGPSRAVSPPASYRGGTSAGPRH